MARRRPRQDYSATATIEVLLASGSMATAEPGSQPNPRSASWQDEAWGYFRTVPEAYNAASFYGDLLARGSLLIEVLMSDGTWAPGIEDGAALAQTAVVADNLLADLGSHDRLLRALGTADMVVGESYLVGTRGQPNWRVVSTKEMKWSNDHYEWRTAQVREGGMPSTELAEGEEVVRRWTSDPSEYAAAISPFRPLLDVLAQICAMTDAITAAGLSRALMGILRIPATHASPAPVGQAEGTDDAHPLQQQLVDVASMAIREPRSAARFVPLVLPVADDVPDAAMKLIEITKGLENLPAGDLLEAAVMRFARGVPLPVEITLGHMSTTFANAAAIATALKRDHIEPALERLSDDLTSGYLVPILTDMGLDATTVRIGFTVEDIHSPDIGPIAAAAKVLIDAGFDPAQVLETVGLDPMDHTGVVTPSAPVADRPMV